MRSPTSVPLHLRLVLVNGLVFAGGVLAMSLSPQEERGVTAAGTLVVGLALIVAVNTRHLRQSLTPLVTTIGTLRTRWENEHRAETARSLATREYDGQRMAEQLHDNVGNNLAAALVALKKVIDRAPPEIAADLKAVQHDARLSFVEVRKIGRRLRPEMLEDLGLHSALGALADGLTARSPSTRVKRRLEGPYPDIDEKVELVVYRVAEAALDNVARHAQATRVDLSLDREDDIVTLRVSDNGVGIGVQDERTGILSMRERASLVGGRLEVGQREGGGTQVSLAVPTRPAQRR